MSRLSNLLRQVEIQNPQLGADLKREVEALSERRAFGLNFERHIPETVELPNRPVRRGDKVRVLPKRGEKPSSVDRLLWRVDRIHRTDKGRVADLVRQPDSVADLPFASRAVDDLVVIAEFRDPIYPGLVSTGKVERGGDRPFHTMINAENFHALQVLLYTHEGNVDAIYIDPPYNTGARDWKYNNDYVDTDDAYRHSKWLAMMERRLRLAKRLLNPDGSVLIVAIDEREVHRLSLLLEQVFEDAEIQMVTNVISAKGVVRPVSSHGWKSICLWWRSAAWALCLGCGTCWTPSRVTRARRAGLSGSACGAGNPRVNEGRGLISSIRSSWMTGRTRSTPLAEPWRTISTGIRWRCQRVHTRSGL